MRHDAIIIIIIIGRSGTTPDHIRRVAGNVVPLKPRANPRRPVTVRMSGLQRFELPS